MAVPASSSLPDATLPELIEEPREPPREKAGIQFAGFAAGIASVWQASNALLLITHIYHRSGMDKGEAI